MLRKPRNSAHGDGIVAVFAPAAACYLRNIGNEIILDDGSVIRASVNERFEAIKNEVGELAAETARGRAGRLALFMMTPADADKIPEGGSFCWDGERWAIEPKRGLSLNSQKALVTLLACSGAVPSSPSD